MSEDTDETVFDVEVVSGVEAITERQIANPENQ